MRMLALPAALLLGAALYTLLPQAEEWLAAGFRALLEKIRQLFTTKKGATDERSALIVYFLAIAAAATILCAIHPIVAAIVMTPLFSGFSPLLACSNTKQELDSGKFSKNIPEYERRVIAACEPLGEAFAHRVAAPMLLCALGMLLHLGAAPGWLYAALCANEDFLSAAEKVLSPIRRASESAVNAILLLCAGLVGRNPLRVGGEGTKEKLLHILSLKGEIDHAPIAGDITQAIFLCCLCTGLLCAALTFIGVFIM